MIRMLSNQSLAKSVSNPKIQAAAVLALCALLMPTGAHAEYSYDTITTGTVLSGRAVGSPFGLGSNLAGDSYTLSVLIVEQSPNYFAIPGIFASDIFNTNLPATVTLTINGTVISTGLATNYGASLNEDSNDLAIALSGADANSNTVTAGQNITTGSAFTSSPDLETSLSRYTFGSSDSGTDTYTWGNATDSQSITLTGTATSVSIAVAEPVSLSLFGLGVLGAGMLRRRKI